MARFGYSSYQDVVAQAQQNEASKIGYFKLKDDGDEALVRINCSSVEELQFASVHTIQANGKWMRVGCLNPLGTYNGSCPLCKAESKNPKTISKAGKKVYLQMLCAYKDRTTGQFSEALPVIWERPASFSRDIANKIKAYGDLRNIVLKLTRNGVAGDLKTTYSMDFIPVYNDVKYIPNDFSMFADFKLERHCFWEKTEEELNTFLSTGTFPDTYRQNNAAAQQASVVSPYANMPAAPNAPIPTAPVPGASVPAGFPMAAEPVNAGYPQAPVAGVPQQNPNPSYTAYQSGAQAFPMGTSTTPATGFNGTAAARTPVNEGADNSQPPIAPASDRPVRNFSGFNF